MRLLPEAARVQVSGKEWTMIKMFRDGSGTVTCDICGREQSTEDSRSYPDGWFAFVDNGNIINVCYDPDCRRSFNERTGQKH